MLMDQGYELGKDRDRPRRSRCLATANRQGFAFRSEVEVRHGQRPCLRHANTRVPQQPHDDAVMVRAVRAEKRTVLVGTQEVVRTLGAWRRLDRAHGIASKGAIDSHEEPGLLEVREEDTQRPDHPSHGRGPREMAVASMESHFPCRQEELEVSRSEIAYATWSEPVAEAPKRIQVLASCRVGATSPAEMRVEALKEPLSGHAFLKTIYAIESISGTDGVSLRPRSYACAGCGFFVSQVSLRPLRYLV